MTDTSGLPSESSNQTMSVVFPATVAGTVLIDDAFVVAHTCSRREVFEAWRGRGEFLVRMGHTAVRVP